VRRQGVGDPTTFPEPGTPGLSSPSQGDEEGAAIRSLNDRAVALLAGDGPAGGDGGAETIHADRFVDVDGTIEIAVEIDDGAPA
jgi:hypothetical protein